MFLYDMDIQMTNLKISTHHIPCTLVDDERRLSVVASILIGLWKINDMSSGKNLQATEMLTLDTIQAGVSEIPCWAI